MPNENDEYVRLKDNFRIYLRDEMCQNPQNYYINPEAPLTYAAQQKTQRARVESQYDFRKKYHRLPNGGKRSRWVEKLDEQKELVLVNEIFDTCYDSILALPDHAQRNVDTVKAEIIPNTSKLLKRDIEKVWRLLHSSTGPRHFIRNDLVSTGSPRMFVPGLSLDHPYLPEPGPRSEPQEDGEVAQKDWQQLEILRNMFKAYSEHGGAQNTMRDAVIHANEILQHLTRRGRMEIALAASIENLDSTTRPSYLLIREEATLHEERQPEANLKEIEKSTATIKYSTKGKDKWQGRQCQNSDIYKHFKDRRENGHTLSSTGAPDFKNFVEPWNCLNIGDTGPPEVPKCLDLFKFRILEYINERLNHQISNTSTDRGTKRTASSMDNDFMGGLRFKLLTQEDAVSLLHCDRYAVITYVRPKMGEKLWITVTFKTEDALARYRKMGVDFDYEDCDLHWRFLRPGDVLIMFRSVPHFVITTRDSWVVGGSVWNGEDLLRILEDIIAEYDNDFRTTNEDAARQFPLVLEALSEMCQDLDWRKRFKIENWDYFVTLLARAKEKALGTSKNLRSHRVIRNSAKRDTSTAGKGFLAS